MTVMVLVVLVLVFILQDQKRVKVSLFTLHWSIPLALDLPFAAVLGGAILLAATSFRALHHRRQARRQASDQRGCPTGNPWRPSGVAT